MEIIINKKMSSTRVTNQRVKILEYLRSVRTHPTAEQVYKAVKKELPAISLATVYRNLNLLAEQGKIEKFEINNEFHFDAHANHCHCVCKNCGKITDLEQKRILDKFKVKNFCPCNIILIGLCKECGGRK